MARLDRFLNSDQEKLGSQRTRNMTVFYPEKFPHGSLATQHGHCKGENQGPDNPLSNLSSCDINNQIGMPDKGL